MLRPKDLIQLWSNPESAGFTLPVVEFYGHSSGPYRSFSNFYTHAPFAFSVPKSCGQDELVAAGRSPVVLVAFAEKAIMLCKAAIMQDYASYDAISRADTPGVAKRLGRLVKHWNQVRWNNLVCDVALEIVLQKFRAVPGLAEVLLSTGERVIAEMTRNDRNWGTGIDIGRNAVCIPAHWQGTNILGWALMVARTNLRKDGLRGGSPALGSLGMGSAHNEAVEVPIETGTANSNDLMMARPLHIVIEFALCTRYSEAKPVRVRATAELSELQTQAKQKLRIAGQARKLRLFHAHSGDELISGETLVNGELIIISRSGDPKTDASVAPPVLSSGSPRRGHGQATN